jgi:hypothetical protein
MSKQNLGTIEYHPFPKIPNESVFFTVDEDMSKIVPGKYLKTKESRRDLAKQLMGSEVFDKLEERNDQLSFDSIEKLREKQKEEFRKQLAEFEKKEHEKTSTKKS